MIQRLFNLHLHAGHKVPLVINANQYDSGEQWLFTLYNGAVQYTPSSGAIVGIKSDRLGIINSGTVDSAGRVVINETKQMTAAVGKNVFELLIDDQTHGTANFIVLVEPKPGDNADFSASDLSLLQQAIDGTSETAIKNGVQEWMDDNLAPSEWVIDSSLSTSGAAADAKKTGDEISALKSAIAQGSGLTADIKQALMNCFNYVAWKNNDPNASQYISALQNALYPPANLTSISAVYTQSGDVYTTDTLDSLKSDLVVTAHYSDSTSEVLAGSAYALSGTLTVGTSTITATYGGKTATFNVTVSVKPYEGYGNITLSDVQSNAYIDENGDVQSYSGSYYDAEYFSLEGSANDLIFAGTTTGNFRICLYDANKNFTRQVRSRVGTKDNYICLLTKANTEVYYRLSWGGANSDTFALYDGTAQNLVMEIGDIDSSTGADKVETKRIRSVDYIPVSGKMNTLNCPFADDWASWASTNCGFFFRCYDSSKNFVGSLLDSSTMFRGDVRNKTLPTNTAFVRIVMQKNSSDMSAGFSEDVINPMVIGTASYWVTEE